MRDGAIGPGTIASVEVMGAQIRMVVEACRRHCSVALLSLLLQALT